MWKHQEMYQLECYIVHEGPRAMQTANCMADKDEPMARVRLVHTQPPCLHTAGAGRQGGESGAVIKSQIKPPPHVVARLSRKYVKELGRMRARKRKAAKAGFIADHKALVK